MPLRIGKLASLTGRRIYNEQHVEWLALLDRLRRSGMSIKELRDYASLVRKGATSLSERQQLLRAHRQLIEQRMTDLGQALEVIDSKIEFYGKWLRTGVQPPLPRIHQGSKQS